MSKKVKRLFLPKSSKNTSEKINLQKDISQINIVAEAELLIENYIKSIGYKSPEYTKKNKVLGISITLSALIFTSFLIFALI